MPATRSDFVPFAELAQPAFSIKNREALGPRGYAMAATEELDLLLDSVTGELTPDGRTLDPRDTIMPRRRADAAGRLAIDSLQKIGAKLEMGEVIGQGGMGTVYAAQQLAMGREVAVKTLKPEVRGEAAMLKLLREAWVTGTLEHPNVVPVYDILLDEAELPQIVLKKIAGAPWSDVMRDEKRIRQIAQTRDVFEWNLRILMQVCNAIQFAHSRGIVHRDLKPENVMIGEFGEVYVLDWGIAVSLRDDGTGRLPLAKEANELAGTPAYMAPEMVGNKADRISPRTDVYLLGAMLYELVVGTVPHPGNELRQIIEHAARGTISLPKDTPLEIGRIIRRAMDPDPDARFESAEQLRLALSGYLEHRGSLLIADEAHVRLDELERARDDAQDDPEAQRQRVYHLFGECRFGFLEALRTWRGNESARTGLRRALELMIDFELRHDDPKAAKVLLAELEDPPEELTERVTEAKRRADEEAERRRKMDNDHDLSIGQRSRVLVGALLGISWTIAPVATWYARSNGIGRTSLVTSALLIALALGVAFRARHALRQTLVNRRLSRAVGIVLIATFLFGVATWRLDLDPTLVQPMRLLLNVVCATLVTSTIEWRLAPAAIALLAAFGLSLVRPDYTYLFETAANAVLTVTLVANWSKRDDALEPTVAVG